MKTTVLLIVSLIFALAIIAIIVLALIEPSVITSSVLDVLFICFIVCGTTWIISIYFKE